MSTDTVLGSAVWPSPLHAQTSTLQDTGTAHVKAAAGCQRWLEMSYAACND